MVYHFAYSKRKKKKDEEQKKTLIVTSNKKDYVTTDTRPLQKNELPSNKFGWNHVRKFP